MKYFYTLLGLICSQFLIAQHHISEVGTPVDGLETTPVVIQENGATSLMQEAPESEQQNSMLLDPIVIEDTDFNGATKGQFSVSNGAATYNLTIETPPGINGVTPKIGITYNSHAGNGIAGYGWNISGLSSISKIGSNKYYDGKNSVINYSSDDRFILDGQRLLLKSGTYGADGAEYQTETYSNLKITSHGTLQSNYGPEYFKVQYPDGSIAYYGRRYKPGFIGSIGAPTRTNTVYALTYLINPQNVVINYDYIVDNENLLVSSIRYGYRSSDPLSSIMVFNGYNSISFTYKNRNRVESGYIYDSASKITKILDKITVRGFAENYRTYQLTYTTTSLGYERLQKITETSGDGSITKSPVTFNYGSDPYQNLVQEQQTVNLTSTEASLSQITSFNTKTIPGDYSGAGKLGYLIYHTTINDGDKQETKGDVLRIFDPGNSTLISKTFVQHFNEVVPTRVLNQNNILLPNQGFTTITRNASVPVNNTFPYRFDSFIFIPEYIGQMALINSKSFNLKNYGDIRDYFISGDLNGDGISDIVRIQHPKNYKDYDLGETRMQIEVIDLKNNTVHITENIPVGFDYRLSDIDKDGYDEFIVIRNKRIFIYKFNQNTNQLEYHQGIVANQLYHNQSNKKPVHTGDFNGDGFLDFVFPKDNGSGIWIFYINMGSKSGTNFKEIEIDTGIVYNENSVKANNNILKPFNHYDIYNYIFTDINNDGKTDIIKTYDYFRIDKNSSSDYDNTSQLWFAENLNFDPVIQTANFSTTHHTFSLPNKQYPIYTVSSYEQKDYKTEFGIITDNRLRTIKYDRNNALTQQLKTINEFDITTKITYDSYDEKKINPAIDGEDAVLPFVSFNQPMSVYPKADINVAPGFYLVKKVTYNTEKGLIIGGSLDRKQLFSYGDATLNYNGKGFLGFNGRMATNIYTGGPTIHDLKDQVKNVTIFDLDNNGLVKEEYVAHSTDWANFFTPPVNFLTKKVNTYNVTSLPNKVFKAQNTQSVINEGLTGIQRTINSTYDTYSNPLSITETVTGGGETSTLNTVFTYIHSLVNDNYYIGRPVSKTVKVNNIQTSKEVYTYANHLLTAIKKQAATGSAELNESNQYDAFGNVIQKTISANDIQPRIANYVYDTSGRYIEKATDTEGLETKYVYNKNRGWLLSQTNPYGLTGSFGYNSFGTVMSETDYLGNTTNFAYKTNTRVLGSSFVRKETTYPDGRKEKVTTIGWGNKTYEGYTDIEGNWIGTSYSYDSQDRIIKKSEPYASTASLFTTFEYDQYGRIIKTVLPTGREITASYNGLSSTVNDGIKTKTETKNANNQTKKVVDNGETINYSYNPEGTLKNTSYSGTVISFEYDGWGRKTKMTDPSAGIYTYEYNSIGDLITEITPNGSTTNTYDATGKIQNTSYSGANISYVYNADKLLDKITTNTDHGNYEEKFAYDAYKRITGKSYSTPYSLTYIYNNTFDELGRVLTNSKTVIGVNGQDIVQTKNVYKNGYLWKLQNAATNTDLKVYNSFNQRGQVTSFTLANGLVTNRSYDQYGYLNQNVVSKNNIQQFTFTNTWDVQRGNLSNRTNSLFSGNIYETFNYDSFDRLTQTHTSRGSTTLTEENISYDPMGRITQAKPGTYNYDAAKKYQLSSIDEINTLPYYQDNPLQQVTYNTQKAPSTIKQQGKENIYFRYDGFNNRTAMYYGNEAADYTASSKVRYYSPAGDIEVDYDKAANKYIVNMYVDGDPYSASIVQRKENSASAFYYLHRDYLGSILAITNNAGNIVEKRHFDAWGNVLLVQNGQNTDLGKLTFLERGYTGHEHLQGVGLINMNARLYDAKLHRFLAPDNFIQDSGNSQSYNRYGYVLNNPLRFTDPSGEIAFVPILVGMAYGAIIGAATSAVIYSATALITQDWNIKSFGKSVLFGAVGGAVGGGFGAVGGQIGSFGQSIGYNILSNMASNAATNLAFGNEITIGNLVGAAVGGFVSSQIGNFNGVKGNDFENIAAEIGFNSTRGALTGSTGGAIGAIIDGKNVKDGIIQGALYGAISGGTLSVTNILLMGPAYLPEREYGNFRNDRPVYRKGHFLWPKSTGISFGRNLVTRLTGDLKFDEYLRAHETGHFIQQRKLGFANFYGKIFGEYMREGFNESYDIPGTLEFDANLHSLKMNGYFWSNKYQYISNSNYEYFY